MVEVKYAVLNSNWIYNLCGPERVPVGWTPTKIKKRAENAKKMVDQRNQTDGFYIKLEESILSEGFRNPIIVTAGLFSQNYLSIAPNPTKTRSLKERIHPSLRENIETLLTCDRWGGSRLWIAQRHNLDIPCIVNDFANVVGDTEILKNLDSVLEKFTDAPLEINFDKVHGVSMSGWKAPDTWYKQRKTYEIKYAVVPSCLIENEICPSEGRQNSLEEENQFFSRLEESILKEGFRNPIVINATKDKITNRYGGSRLLFAQKHNLDIPCIIADFDNVFPDAKKIAAGDMVDYFTDPPMYLYLQKNGINASGCKHVHLSENQEDV